MKELLQFWPQICISVIMLGSSIKTWILDGTERKFTKKPLEIWIRGGIYVYLLIAGGFFRYWGGAQIIYCILLFFVILLVFRYTIGYAEIMEKSKGKTKISSTFLSNLILFFLYYWGGFFDGLIQKLMK